MSLSFLILTQVAHGQQDRTGFDLFDETDSKTTKTQNPSKVIQQRGVALESTVDPEKYYVGPSDVFSVNIWISPPVSFSLIVSPEGTLIVPTVGEIAISDMTIAEARKKVIAEIKKKYISGNATITLIIPRSIVVTVTGNVLFPGAIVLTSTDRVEKAIQEANKFELARREDVAAVQRAMSTRNVTLKRKDGTIHRLDLKKYYVTKEDSLNPYLREGDNIFVPWAILRKNFVAIYGEVNLPGQYEYVSGDSITDIVKLAYGFTRFAIGDSVDLSRLDASAKILSTRIVNVTKMLNGSAPNVPIEPGDRIVVRSKPELREDYRVIINGEILYPGTYPITKDQTRLSHLIRVAGGFTEYADLQRAELNRGSIPAQEVALERLLSFRGSVSTEDSAYYITETELRLRKEIVNIDFNLLFSSKDSSVDIILQSGDYIYIPSAKKTIYVFGQVVSPGLVTYSEGKGTNYYFRLAGGLTDEARSGDIKVIKAKTKQWLSENETKIEEGDYIWVPKKITRPFIYYSTVASHVASILTAIVGVAIVAATLSR